jgi:hypothetical protein
MRRKREKGQATLLVLLASSIFVIGALGLAIDGAQLYAHRQMAQVAADAAAQAGIMTYFDGTNTSSNSPSASPYTCLPADVNTSPYKTACKYAALNGFVPTSGGDNVQLEYGNSASPSPSTPAGVSLSSDPVSWVKVTVTRNVRTTLIGFVGAANSINVKAVATAAIVNVISPVPILVTHPTRAGSFSTNGGSSGDVIKILGGPSRSIQVNSCAGSGNAGCDTSGSGSIRVSGGATVNLSQAGPSGHGADFGDFGGPSSYPGSFDGGADGNYLQPASPILDPLASVLAPSPAPAAAPAPVTYSSAASTEWGCPGGGITCQHYFPGKYTSGINVSGYALFEPGLYYITSGGFNIDSNTAAAMVPSSCSTCATPPADFATRRGMLVFNSGDTKDDTINFNANAGTYKSGGPGTELGITLVGSDEAGTYKGILFFQDRTSHAHNDIGAFKGHSIQGGATLSLTGTIYLTNTVATMTGDATHFQALTVQGNGSSATTILGEIIADTLKVGGTAGVAMTLNAGLTLKVRQVALVK